MKEKYNSVLCGMALFVCGETLAQLIGIQSFASRIYPKLPVCFVTSIITAVGFFILVKRGYEIVAARIAKVVIKFIGKNSMVALFIHTIEFEFLLDYWVPFQISSITIMDQLLHGCISCFVNFLILCVYVKAKNKIEDVRGLQA